MAFVFISIQGAPLPHIDFPIEIAWVRESGAAERHMIRPPALWLFGFRGNEWTGGDGMPPSMTLDQLKADGEPLESVAARVVAQLRHPDVHLVGQGDWTKARLDRLLFKAGHGALPLGCPADAQLGACLGMLKLVPSYRSPDYQRVWDDLNRTTAKIVADAYRVEALRTPDESGALGEARAMWRVWSAVAAEADRVFADPEGEEEV